MRIITVSPRYQITIPKEIRERFKLKPGDKVLFISRGKTIEVVFARSNEELTEFKRLHSNTSKFPSAGTMSENSKV